MTSPDENPFSKENNPFSSGGDGGENPNGPEQGSAPAMSPAAEPLTTKPRQMPGGAGGGGMMDSTTNGPTDTNVPQGADTMKSAAAYIRQTNPHLSDQHVHYLARKVAEFNTHPPQMAPPPKRVQWGAQTGIFAGGDDKAGNLMDPENPLSPLHPDNPHHEPNRTEWGNLNSRFNPLSPLHENHPMNAQVMKGVGDFAQQGVDYLTKRYVGSRNSVVAFFEQYDSDDEGEPTGPLVL